MKKLLFIYNPNAGKGSIKKAVSDILEKFSAAGYVLTVFPTAKSGDAKKLAAKKGNKYDLLVCAGGDGTFNEVANGIMKLKEEGKKLPVVGYIPAGTVNDFATSLNLPKNEPVLASDIIIDGKEMSVDMGSFTALENVKCRYFTYVAAFGAFTEVAYETSQEVKNVIGKAAYFLEGLKSIQKIRPYRIKVTYDDGEIEDDFIFGMVANSKSVGGFKGITGPEVYLDDGKFDIILVKNPETPMDLQNIINSFIMMDMKTESLYHFHSSKIVFEAGENIPWTLDGEAGGASNGVIINNLKRAITIKVPEKTAVESGNMHSDL